LYALIEKMLLQKQIIITLFWILNIHVSLAGVFSFVVLFPDTPTKLTPAEIELIHSEADTAPMRILTVKAKEDSVILRTKSTEILADRNDTDLARLCKRMYYSMLTNEGIGISAPQVGVNRKIIWVRRMDKTGNPFELYLNPHIITTSDTTVNFPGDGCLSLPGVMACITRRPKWIDVEYDRENGSHYEEKIYYGGFLQYTSVIFQHEIDHLNGILYLDRLIYKSSEKQ
jgi:peptide deformylase